MTPNNETPTLNWLDDHFDLFLPPLNQATFDRKLLQRVGELALLYRALHLNGLGSSDLMNRWKNSLIEYIESEELVEIARKNLGSSWAWLMPYFVFRSLHGITVDEHERTILFSHESGYPDVSEVVPYRKMDQHYFLSMHAGSQLNIDDFVSSTSLSHCRNLLTIDRDTAYSITHTLFYTNDFGSKRMTDSHPAHKKCLAIIDSLLPEFARKADWDVLGEIIILGLCTDGVDEEILSSYLNLFRSQRNILGYTPPSDATKAVLSEDMDREKIFEACYHTTLVAALVETACAASQKESVAAFNVSPLDCSDEGSLLRRVVASRNKAVEFLNYISASGESIQPISAFANKVNIETLETTLDVALSERENILAFLELGDIRSEDDIISHHACSLTECFARNGDAEVVLKFIGSCFGGHSFTPRWNAILHFLLQLQKPDGSIGYFIQEGRMLGADNISPIKISLTDVYVQAIDTWLDARLEKAA